MLSKQNFVSLIITNTSYPTKALVHGFARDWNEMNSKLRTFTTFDLPNLPQGLESLRGVASSAMELVPRQSHQKTTSQSIEGT